MTQVSLRYEATYHFLQSLHWLRRAAACRLTSWLSGLSLTKLESRDESECVLRKYFGLIRAVDFFGITDVTNEATSFMDKTVNSWFTVENQVNISTKIMIQIRSAVQTIYENPQTDHSGPLRLLLVKHAFRSRIFLYNQPVFPKILQEWPLFALGLFQNSLSSNEWGNTGRSYSLDKRCARCGESIASPKGKAQQSQSQTSKNGKPIGELTVQSIKMDLWCADSSDHRGPVRQVDLWRGNTKI